MPANFGEIANYHHRLAAQHMELARAARDAGDPNAAEYNRELAARYIEAAEEQKSAMSQAPGRALANQAPRPWAQTPSQIPKPARKPSPKPASKIAPKHAPLAVACLSLLSRGATSVAGALQQSLATANASLQKLSFEEPPPTPAPQLRG
jgi:hypothetical protein